MNVVHLHDRTWVGTTKPIDTLPTKVCPWQPVTARDSPWQLVFECAKKLTSLARMSLNFWYVFGVFGTHPWQDVTARDSPSSRLTHRCWDSGFFNNSCSKMFQASFARVCFRLILFSPVVMAVISSFIFNRLGFYTNANWLIHALQLLCSFFSFFWTPTNQVPWPWYHFITRSKKVKAGISIAHCPLKTKPSIACLVNIVAQIQKGFLSYYLFFFFSL